MIGLPYQTLQNLANDLMFMKEFDIDMIGMGPYLVHENTPLYALRDMLLPLEERLQLSFKMMATFKDNDEGCKYSRHNCLAGH